MEFNWIIISNNKIIDKVQVAAGFRGLAKKHPERFAVSFDTIPSDVCSAAA